MVDAFYNSDCLGSKSFAVFLEVGLEPTGHSSYVLFHEGLDLLILLFDVKVCQEEVHDGDAV